MKMFEHCSPARLNVLEGAVQTMQLPSDPSGMTVASTVWQKPGMVRSLWISSEQMKTPWSQHICATRESSSADQTRPTGLCGLHRMSIFVPGSAQAASSPSKSIS